MPELTNEAIARVFAKIADLMRIRGENSFRVRAFERSAEAVANLPEAAATMLERGTLAKVPGIGSGTLERLKEILATGTCGDLQALQEQLPAGLLELLEISGLGPKTVKLVYDELGIDSVDALEAAARAGHIAQLPRMGEKSQEKLLRAILGHRRRKGRTPLGQALPQGRALVEQLGALSAVERIDLAGSLRRRRDTIGDLDVLVATEAPEQVAEAFATLPQVREVIARGDTKCSVLLESGLQADLRVLALESYGAALHYFTGSQQHNIALRDRAKRRGLRVNEYGVFREADGTRLGGATEAEIFGAVGLPFIPPELRENHGEIEAAERGTLPVLVEQKDLRGDLHVHTSDSDGAADAEVMARAAAQIGLEYLAITDHSKAMIMARGLDEARVTAQGEQLRALAQLLGIHILSGIEVDIVADGTLDLDRAVLAERDWVVASVHSHLEMPREQMTARVVRAMESGVVDCIGHPTGRIIGGREPYAVDVDALLEAARRTGVAVELNASPSRLDLDANHCRHARELGVPVVINSDAHAPAHLAWREYGIYTARRAWLEPANVLNTWPIERVVAWRRARLS